jgi:hypothetical protein
MFTKIIIITIILGLSVFGFFYSLHDAEQKFKQEIEQKKALQDQKLPQEKPAFESELTLIIPAAMRRTQAPYGEDFSVHHLQTLGHNQDFNGYDFSRVFRVNNLSTEEIESQIRSHLEKNGYTVDSELSSITSAHRDDFQVDIQLIPFEDKGFIDVKVELYRKY